MCIAQCTNKKQGVIKVMQSKFQRLHLHCCFVCLSLFLAQKRVLQIVFLFGCYAVVANCAFARYCQIFVAFITSARYCVGILRFSQCIFVVLQHNKSDLRYLLFVFNLSTAKNRVCNFLCFSNHLCVETTFCVLFDIGQNFSAGKGSFCNVLHLLNTTYKENLTSP